MKKTIAIFDFFGQTPTLTSRNQSYRSGPGVGIGIGIDDWAAGAALIG